VSAVPNNNAHSISEVATVNDVNTLTSNATTFRARFVGQGYKQVKSIVLAIHNSKLDELLSSDT
jgi:hypothetical protein